MHKYMEGFERNDNIVIVGLLSSVKGKGDMIREISTQQVSITLAMFN